MMLYNVVQSINIQYNTIQYNTSCLPEEHGTAFLLIFLVSTIRLAERRHQALSLTYKGGNEFIISSIRPLHPPTYLYCWQGANFTMGHNGQSQHFAELRQKVCSSIHALVLQRGLPSLDGKLERFVTKKMKKAVAKLESDRLS